MPSPFPGMDPWLEDEEVFPNLHDRLIIAIQDALNAVLPKGYAANTRNRVWVDSEQRQEPDIALYGRDRPPTGVPPGTVSFPGLIAVGQRKTSDPMEEPYLEIYSNRGKRLVTSVEVVSRANKRAGRKGRKAYQAKQEECALSRVNLVEIDLLRQGPHVTATPLSYLRRTLGPFEYHVSVMAAGDPPTYHAAGIRLTDRLPAIGVPLDPGMPAATIDLQPMLDAAYERSRYTEFFDYRQPCDPPLTADQQAWADGLLRAKGLLP